MKTISILLLPVLLLGFSSQKIFAQGYKDTSVRNIASAPIIPGAQFPGGEKEFKKFVRANIHPVKGANGKKVFISFTIEKDGSLSHFKIKRSINMAADSEAMRVLRLSPKWEPVIFDGQAQSSQYKAGIAFPK